MINNENLENMYKKIVEGKELTTKELYNCGFSQNDLTNLVKEKILERVKRGKYKLLKLSRLNDYAKKFIFKDNDYAIKIFEKSYLLDPKNSFTLLNLFNSAIINFEEEKILDFLNIISNLSKYNYAKSDYYIYIFLLQFLMPLPEHLKEQIASITYEDLKIDEKDIRNSYSKKENEIRLAIFNREFDKVYKFNNINSKMKSKLWIQDIIIREIIRKIFEKEKEFNELLNACIIQKKYGKMCKLIRARGDNHLLSTRDEMIIKLANDLINLNNSNNCDKYLVLESSKNKNLEKTVFGNDFYQALKIRTKELLKKGKNLSDDIIYLLLYEICNKLDNLKISKEEKIEICFEKIIHYINDNKKSIAKKFVKEYLDLTNNNKYEALLLLYFELMELDQKYNNEFINIITSLNNNTYTFNVATVIGDFYLALFSKNFKKAKIFLEIIKNGKILSKEIYDEKLFVDAFNATIELMNDTKPKENSKQKIEITKKEKSKLVDKKVVKTIDEPSIYEIEFIENKRLQILEENEIVLLKKMNENRYKNIEKILDDIPDITYYYAGRGEDKRMFLKRSYEKIEIIETSEYSNIITDAYNKEDFETALYYLKELLYNGYNNLWIYYRIGIIYFRTCNFDLASDYLTIVNLMNREINGKFDLTDFVIFIDNVKKGKDNLRNYKPKFNMQLEEFEIDINDYYGIDNFEEINEQILISGLDVETACTNLGLSYEQIDLIKLIYAKLYYYQGEYELGDKFLNSVEHIKDKSVNVRNIQNYIKTNRNYYVNRVHEKDLSFVRRLKP